MEPQRERVRDAGASAAAAAAAAATSLTLPSRDAPATSATTTVGVTPSHGEPTGHPGGGPGLGAAFVSAWRTGPVGAAFASTTLGARLPHTSHPSMPRPRGRHGDGPEDGDHHETDVGRDVTHGTLRDRLPEDARRLMDEQQQQLRGLRELVARLEGQVRDLSAAAARPGGSTRHVDAEADNKATETKTETKTETEIERPCDRAAPGAVAVGSAAIALAAADRETGGLGDPVLEARRAQMLRIVGEIGDSTEADTRGMDEVCAARAGAGGPEVPPGHFGPAVSAPQTPQRDGGAARVLAAVVRAQGMSADSPASSPESDDSARAEEGWSPVSSGEGDRDGEGDRERGGNARTLLPASVRYREALIHDPPRLPPAALRVSAFAAPEAQEGAWAKIRVADTSLSYASSWSGDEGEGEGDDGLDVSQATVRVRTLGGPRRVVEEDEEDDESMVIAMRYLGDAAFRKTLVSTGDEELLGYLKERRLL